MKTLSTPRRLFVMALTACLFIGTSTLSSFAASFTTNSPMTTARRQHTTTLLPDGKILVVGGTVNASAEIYNPLLGTWTQTQPMSNVRQEHTATLLPNGKVLVAGGHDNGSVPVTHAELFNPVTGTWSTVAATNQGR